MNRSVFVAFTLTLGAAYQLPAQDADSSNRGVARLSLLNGDVSVRRGDTGEWVAAAMNAPVMSEDQVLTGANSHAEVQLDYSQFARISGNTELRLADLENHKYLLRLARGTMTFRVLRNMDSEAEISTPSVAIRPQKKGTYRVAVLEDGSTEVTVRNGEAEIFTPKGTQHLKSGRTMLARGNPSDPEFQFVNAPATDEWDQWNESRDRQLENTKSYEYVSQEIPGAEDLDANGRWENTQDYGNVWVPNATPDWAPYRNGRWAWVDYYGWNWVSYDPWGWAPYHYGRWVNRPNVGWCWWPGQRHSHHYWSPAQVAFFGWGGGYGGFSVGVGFGHMGWVPLAPFETYYPWYGRGYYGGYRNGGHNNVTIVNNTNITNVYRNARVNNGITSVDAAQFGRGTVNNVRYNRSDIESASMVRGQLPVAPDTHSTRLTDHEARITDNRGATRADNNFYSTRQATRLDRVPFENQRSSLQETSRRTFGDPAPVSGGRGSDAFTGRVAGADRGADRSAERVTPAATRNSESGSWRRFGDSSSASAATSTATTDRSAGRGGNVDTGASSRTSESGSWRRFGDSTAPATSTPAPAQQQQRGADSTSWRRMSETPTSARVPVDRSTPAHTVGTTDRGAGRGSSGMDSAPRISAPPVVRERAMPSHQQQQSAPRSAPPSGTGGGRSGESGGRGGDSGGSRGSSHNSGGKGSK